MAKSYILAAALTLSLTQSFAGAALAEALTVTHAQGETVLAATPKSVMVSDWAAFDNLMALGVPVAGVPASNVPPYLKDRITPEMVQIGSLQEPDVEAIMAAAPDLMIVAARSRQSYPTLAALLSTLDLSIDNADVIGGTKHNITLLGQIFDRADKAVELNDALDAKVAVAKAAVAGKGTGLVIVTNGSKIGIYGPESRVSWIYNALEVPSVFDNVDDRDHGGDAITFEYLLKTNPDWLFVIDRDAGVGSSAGTAKALLDNELIHQTNFWKNDRIVYLDSSAAYVTMNGYDALNLLLDQVIEAFSKG
ncbi:ABC transporter substrate-binding protein [Xinfangfangia sp. CPCC 101601]|uniref:ABC transporter substrate-binding protein n=1 Tax=Pseudogemmobacter lacusdianii TaxID=3069608 RepID=A0ABU0W1H4_9RHOB|nr:ABC transporter substrate-binding protein [Xinfangfangia sp. CPCC 101601]MDQ2067867.1 ABC transporter substrate-binding protein [Xinfangfangia sp. CPCC 101601]